MKTIIAALAAAAASTCFAASSPAEQTEANPTFIYATYFHCNKVMFGQADKAVASVYGPALKGMVKKGAVSSWGWLGKNTGGEWARAGYLTGPSIEAVLDASDKLEMKSDIKPPSPRKEGDTKLFAEACGSSEDYIWHVLAGNDARERRGKAAFSTYYVCDQSRETQADALVKKVLAPMYDKLVADGKLTSWGWAEHIVGGKYRRLATMTAQTVEALIATRAGIVAAAEHDPLSEAFTSICGSHQDYIWELIMDPWS